MPSRSLDDLSPGFRAQAIIFESAAEFAGLDLLIYCTHRTMQEQAILFRNGRNIGQIKFQAQELTNRWGRADLADILLSAPPQYGKRKVTNAAPGESYHNYGLAFDAVPLRGGKPVWSVDDAEDFKLWKLMGSLAHDAGMEWGGDWRSFKDYPHCQQSNINWHDLIRQVKP